MDVPGGLTRPLPRVGPTHDVEELRQAHEAFMACPAWLWQRMELNANTVRVF